MQLSLRNLITLLVLMSLISLAACRQQSPPSDNPSVTRSSGGGNDQSALAEAIVAILYIATKQAWERGECEQRLDKEAGAAYTRQRLLCDRLVRQYANPPSVGPNTKPRVDRTNG
jgi:hypothetical protein